MAHIIDAVIQLKDDFSATLQTVENNMGNFQRTTRNMAKDINRTGRELTKLGSSMTKGITVPVIGAGVAAAKMGMDFNESMASIATMIPGQRERLQKLKGDIQDIAVETAKSTAEIADGTYAVISAYGDAEDTMDKVAINAKAAQAGMATTNDALNLSSAVMKGFGDTSAEANRKVMDLAFETLRLGQTSFPDMAASIGAVVPLTNELGIAQEELFAVYATATGVTGNASEVSTQYRGALKALMAPTKEMTTLMQQLGYADGKAMIEKEGLIGAFETIVKTAKSSGTPLQKYIGSIQGQTLALSLAGEQSDVYREKLLQLEDSSGAMERAFREQTEGVNATGFSFKQSMIKMQVSAQKFGDTLAPMIDRVADGFSRFADMINNLTPEQREMIVKFAGIAAAIGPVVLIIGKLTQGVSRVMFKFADFAGKAKKMGGIMNALLSPGNMVVLLIAGIALAALLIYKNWDKITAWTEKTFPNMKETIATAMGHIRNIFAGVTTFISFVFRQLVPVFTGIWGAISNVFIVAAETIGTVVGALLQVFSGIVDFIVGVFTGDWELAWQAIQDIFGGIFDGLVALAKAPLNLIIGLVNGVIGGLNKIKLPKWVPKIGGKGIDIPLIPKLAAGTMGWRGGIVQVHERGGEIIDLPRGSRVYPHDESLALARVQGRVEGARHFNIAKLADTLIVREEADIDKIATALAKKLTKAEVAFGGA